MAISKKGLRAIVVDGQKFYWKFSGKILVVSELNENAFLTVDFGWYDVWLYTNDQENKPPDFEPKKVTPQFVHESISYALTHGWAKEKMEIIFRNGLYKKKA